MRDFYEDWNSHRQGLRPIGFLLRTDGAKHWLRFHSLPESKRYAETLAERQILLSRQTQLAKEVLGEEPCWLVQAQWGNPPGITDMAHSHDPFRLSRECGLMPAFEFIADQTHWNVHALLVRWADEKFEEFLLEICR